MDRRFTLSRMPPELQDIVWDERALATNRMKQDLRRRLNMGMPLSPEQLGYIETRSHDEAVNMFYLQTYRINQLGRIPNNDGEFGGRFEENLRITFRKLNVRQAFPSLIDIRSTASLLSSVFFFDMLKEFLNAFETFPTNLW